MLCGGVALAAFATQASTYSPYKGDPALPRIAASIYHSARRDGRGVAVSLGPPGAPTADWPDVVGVLIAASREGYQPCVTNAAWKFMMTSQYICSSSQARCRWRISVDQSNVPIPNNASVLFRNAKVEVYTTAPSFGPNPK